MGLYAGAMSQIIHLFDAYGTLFDVHSVVAAMRAEIGPQGERLSEVWRAKTLENTWIYALAGKPASFRKCLQNGLDYAISATGPVPAETRQRLIEAYDSLAAFPEVKDTLLGLKKKRARLAILSNGDADMLDKAVRSAGLETLFDHLLSASDVGVFKPSSRVYRMALTKFGATREEVTFVSANRWDIAGASAFGFKTVWVNRGNAPEEYADMPAASVVPDLTGLPLLMATG